MWRRRSEGYLRPAMTRTVTALIAKIMGRDGIEPPSGGSKTHLLFVYLAGRRAAAE